MLVPQTGMYLLAIEVQCCICLSDSFSPTLSFTFKFKLHISGIPSEPRITGVTPGVNMFTLTVQLYAGHTSSLYFNVSVISIQGSILVPNLQAQNSVSTNLINYTITVPFNQRGQTRFMATARNSFGDTMESAMFPPMEMDGVEGMLKVEARHGSVGLQSKNYS